jgi:hypothetical protein
MRTKTLILDTNVHMLNYRKNNSNVCNYAILPDTYLKWQSKLSLIAYFNSNSMIEKIKSCNSEYCIVQISILSSFDKLDRFVNC